MGWKIFAVFMAVSFGFGLLSNDTNQDAISLISIPISAVANTGLVAYAFDITKLQSRHWVPFSWLLALWSIVTLAVLAVRAPSMASPIWAIVGGGVIGAAVLYFQWLAIYRLGRFSHPPAPDVFVD